MSAVGEVAAVATASLSLVGLIVNCIHGRQERKKIKRMIQLQKEELKAVTSPSITKPSRSV